MVQAARAESLAKTREAQARAKAFAELTAVYSEAPEHFLENLRLEALQESWEGATLWALFDDGIEIERIDNGGAQSLDPAILDKQ